MDDWEDKTQWDTVAKKVYDLLLDQWKRLRRAASDVILGGHFDSGVQTFRVERKRTIQLLSDWFGVDEATDFENLPSTLLTAHPAVLASSSQCRAYAKAKLRITRPSYRLSWRMSSIGPSILTAIE